MSETEAKYNQEQEYVPPVTPREALTRAAIFFRCCSIHPLGALTAFYNLGGYRGLSDILNTAVEEDIDPNDPDADDMHDGYRLIRRFFGERVDMRGQ